MFQVRKSGQTLGYFGCLLSFGIGSGIPPLVLLPSVSEDGPFDLAVAMQLVIFVPLALAQQMRVEADFPNFFNWAEIRVNESFLAFCLYIFTFSLATSLMGSIFALLPLGRWQLGSLILVSGVFTIFYFVSSLNYLHRAQEARRLIEPAGLGDAEAQRELGLALLRQGGRKANEEAGKWLRRAASQGNAKAQWHLGNMYFIGKGVPKDFAEAYVWYSISSIKWQNEIDKELPVLAAQKLSSEALEQAQARARKLDDEIHAQVVPPLADHPISELTMPLPTGRVDLRWAKPLPEFRPRMEGEPMREYMSLLGEFKSAASAKQKQDYLDEQASDPGLQMPT